MLGAHPLFGPTARTLEGKTVILTPIDPSSRALADRAANWLKERQTSTVQMTPSEHDSLMEPILALTHYIGLATAAVLVDHPLRELLRYAGPTHTALQALAVTVATDSPEMLADIQATLDPTPHVGGFLKQATKLADMIEKGEGREFELWAADLAERLRKKVDPGACRETLYRIYG